MQIKQKRVLKNGATAGYVYYPKDRKWKWRIILGPSEKKGRKLRLKGGTISARQEEEFGIVHNMVQDFLRHPNRNPGQELLERLSDLSKLMENNPNQENVQKWTNQVQRMRRNVQNALRNLNRNRNRNQPQPVGQGQIIQNELVNSSNQFNENPNCENGMDLLHKIFVASQNIPNELIDANEEQLNNMRQNVFETLNIS